MLHTYSYRETSLVVEVFSREFGRIGMIAKGAKRPKSPLRGLLTAFHPLSLSWSGKLELKTLHGAEWRGSYRHLAGRALICGFYLNELLLKLLHRDDPHDGLFDAYEQALDALITQTDHAAALRRFEKHLLRELGYALILDEDAVKQRALEPAQHYVYVIGRGPVPMTAETASQGIGVELAGQTLLDIAADNYASAVTRLQSRTLMRTLIGHYLGNQTLHSRQLLLDLQEL